MIAMRTAKRALAVLATVATVATLVCPARAADEKPAKPPRPETATLKKSWIDIQPVDTKGLKEGEEFKVTVKYFLDAADNWGDGTVLSLMPLGPWVDCPDGKYATKRQHIMYPGMWGQDAKIEPGAGSHVFTFKVSKLYKYNGILWLAAFKGGDGNNWPWDIRSGGPELVFEDKFFQLTSSKPGSLFVYDEPVELKVEFTDGAVKGETKTLKYKITDTKGAVVKTGEQAITVGAKGESTALKLDIKERGTFLIQAGVDGWGDREALFARIPDVMKITGGARTQFAATNLHTDGTCKIARMLGFTSARLFMDWRAVQPGREQWHFEGWDKILDANKANGIDAWICITNPPVWVLNCPASNVGYEPFPFEEAGWKNSVETMTARWKDKMWGWEWLNEIVPGGKSKTPAEDYAKLCAIGTEAAKRVNPSLKTLMAGGLWPRNFRNDCLKAGMGKDVDVLPVHYSDMGGVLEAMDDLAASHNEKVTVWDDESSHGASTWNMPNSEVMKITSQSQWFLDHFPDELQAGAEKVTFFGGWTDACGNWTCLMDERTPRPLCATLAVMTSKLAGAKPVGKFFLPEQGVFQLFEKDGKSILVASASTDKGEKIELNSGSGSLTITDYQGNETSVAPANGKAALQLSTMPVFVEGGDLDILKSYCTVNVGNGRQIDRFPKTTVIKGLAANVQVSVRNVYAKAIEGTISIGTPEGWPASERASFSLKPGASEHLELPIKLTDAVAAGDYQLKLQVEFKDAALPKTEKPFGLAIISKELVGNLLKNGDFEVAGATETQAAEWGGSKQCTRHPSGGGLGLGKSVLQIEKAENYESIGQGLNLPPGQTYLYSAWVWNQKIGGGSNIIQTMTDGTSRPFYTPAVFMTADSSATWHLYSCKTSAPANLKTIAFVPVMKGPGVALYDNLRVSLYEGTNYAAECHKAKGPIKIDGKLDDWDTRCPIPLLCENQLSPFDKAYKWTPENMSGVAYLNWDEKYLYFAAEVIDDVHVAKTTGDETINGDSIVLGIHPANRATGKDDKAFAYYLSSASPGGGSGASTLFRPTAHSGGLSTGNLAWNSSVYEINIHTEGNKTTYEVRMPWGELGGINPAFGSKFGLSLLLNDNDGNGRAASMTWGDGLVTGWAPSNFGIATLVGE